uniref:Uncharacterized protein n=1 Tax=Rhizophora mucronata TaxID=61149 RepID=A0A2P2NGK8_RHIMU
MAEIKSQKNPTFQSFFHVLDPISLILSQNSSNSNQLMPLRLATGSYIMERGPRYRAYAELRESRLRMKSFRPRELEESDFKQTPPRKQVKFQTNLAGSRKGSSVLAQSVPDFSATLRKENGWPPPPPTELASHHRIREEASLRMREGRRVDSWRKRSMQVLRD